MVVGIDEVGRGPWAGPLVFGAVVLGGDQIDGLTDSKKLTAKKRLALDVIIREKALAYGLGWVSAAELDEIGMSNACELGCRRALEQITVAYSDIIIDGTVNFLATTGKGPYVKTIKQADLLVPCVSAASIIAKVARDSFMAEQDARYPGYGFAAHVGYGTKQHAEALTQLGVCPLHRTSFAPIAKLLGIVSERKDFKHSFGSVTTRQIGNRSEDAAVAYLQTAGYLVLERNWKTKRCEIDIVAEKDGMWYFVEVKHRKTDQQGGGLAAITPQKLEQMKFASRIYLHWAGQDDLNCRLAVVVTDGNDYHVSEIILLNDRL